MFTLAMMIKGGWLARIKKWREWELQRAAILDDPRTAHFKYLFVLVAHWLLDEKQVSAFIVLASLAAIQPDFSLAVFAALAWAIVSRISMGEEAGGIGDYVDNRGDYVEWLGAKKGRSFAVKKGVQYGATFGAALAIATGSMFFIVAGVLFPLVYFAGNSLYRKIHTAPSWAYSEIFWGLCFDVALIGGLFW